MCGSLRKIEPNENERSFGGSSGSYFVARDRISGLGWAGKAHLSEAFGLADGFRRKSDSRGAVLTAQI
jgi:hypothetical protein